MFLSISFVIASNAKIFAAQKVVKFSSKYSSSIYHNRHVQCRACLAVEMLGLRGLISPLVRDGKPLHEVVESCKTPTHSLSNTLFST